MNNINLEPKLVGSIVGLFFVPAYQRGYRWKDEAEMLLNDIDEIIEGHNYSLQPIVVKNIGEEKYELIDGQQRLTTIFLIFRYMKQLKLPFQLNFSLEYETKRNKWGQENNYLTRNKWGQENNYLTIYIKFYIN
ncbi:MAG: DUF262 domain-containing protein [Deltaproteobacteria bacterium]|nr:DUF262 domain-containing protein [Deltaproteobacteria bacterium]